MARRLVSAFWPIWSVLTPVVMVSICFTGLHCHCDSLCEVLLLHEVLQYQTPSVFRVIVGDLLMYIAVYHVHGIPDECSARSFMGAVLEASSARHYKIGLSWFIRAHNTCVKPYCVACVSPYDIVVLVFLWIHGTIAQNRTGMFSRFCESTN